MRLRLTFLLLLAFTSLGRATSVVPPSFPELVAEADAIYRGRVTAVQARRVERTDAEGSVIKTFVTIAIDRVLKGPERPEVTLEFLGGTVGEDTLTVVGMPKFSVGSREFVFVQKNGVQFCPLVAMTHGRYRVMRDEATAREHMARDNGAPLTSTADVELPLTALPEPVRAANAASAADRALTPDAFETSIRSEMQRIEERARPN
jgi:hypothetical protein